ATGLAPVGARLIGLGIEHDICSSGRHDDDAQPQPAAELTHILPSSGPLRDGQIDALAHRQAIDALQDEAQPEAALELDDDRRLVTANAHHIAAAHLALDLVPPTFQ